MPSYRGIKISIISQSELRIHPEFPHPESSQFTHRNANSPLPLKDAREFGSKASIESKADRLLGRPSALTVYIPSVSGQRFWIHYKLAECAITESDYYYFKLFMNGRHVTSFGTDSAKHPSGQVMKALFEPSNRWNSKQDGVVYKKDGTEARQFYFKEHDNENSAAVEGGLIEVQVFRARGRKRRQPKLEEHRDQSQYGIFMPSGGLVDDAEDKKYYDWLLYDAKDRPFADFKFQYRSWDYLSSLQIIREDAPRQLLEPTTSLLDLNRVASKTIDLDTESSNEGASHYEVISPEKQDKDSISSDGSATPWNTGVFDSEPEPIKKLPPGIQPSYVIPPRISSKAADQTPYLEDAWTELKQRPLPLIPDSNSTRAHSRKSSGSGMSIATSLQSYMSRSHAGSPEPEIGVAVTVPVPSIRRAASKRSLHLEADSPSTTRTDSGRSTGSPRQNMVAVARNRRPSPAPMPHIADMSNVTVRKLRRTPTKITTPEFSDENNKISQLTAHTNALTLNEAEWMNTIPSAIRRSRGNTVAEEMWSQDYGCMSGDGSRLRRKSFQWYDEPTPDATVHNGTNIRCEDNESRVMDSSNWI